MVQRQINWSLIDRVRTKNPIVLNLANLVTIDKVADALSINLGTINEHQATQIRTVLRAATPLKPLVLDPVAVSAVPSRLKFAHSLLNDFHFDVIRGNASEIAALVEADNTSH